MTKQTKDLVWMIVSLAAGFAVSRLTPTPPLTLEGLAVLGVFLSSLMMWITISIDWPSLITLFLLGLLPHFGFPAVFRGAFGNVTVAFLLFTLFSFIRCQRRFLSGAALWLLSRTALPGKALGALSLSSYFP